MNERGGVVDASGAAGTLAGGAWVEAAVECLTVGG